MISLGVLLLIAGVIGTLSSAVYLVLALLGLIKFRKEKFNPPEQWPPVSLLKPLHGNEPQLECNLASFFEQDYAGVFEIIFAIDHADDAALPIVKQVCERYASVHSRILITGEPAWPNPPAYSFSRMAETAQYDILVTSDSDVQVDRDYLSSVVPPLCSPQNGMLTCLYRGKNLGGFWSALDAVGMSVEMSAGVLAANLLEGMKFGLGPTIAVRRDALREIGGYEALGDYFSNDFVIGNLVAAQGKTVILSQHIISHIVPPMTFTRMWRRQVRWATGTKHSRPKGHFGTVFVFAVPYGLAALLGGLLAHRPVLGFLLFAVTVANRLIENYAIGWGVTRDRECLMKPWLYPLRDLLGFAVWVASYLSRNMSWRDGRFELVKGGRIRVRDRVALEPE
ncbi:MAG TPA: glycosyltransferase [Bryobacteraceae bacterium]|jgi:ceramide glucosyltransferase